MTNSKLKIGIPRALFYWKKPLSTGIDGGGFWETFFEKLGAKVVLSPETNKKIVEKGVKMADPGACFSTKVFLGHILWFNNQKIDYLFVPRLKTNDEKLEYCPRFFALPDLTKILVNTKILTETFDARKNLHSFQKKIPVYFKESLYRLGKKIGADNEKTEEAIKSAILKEEKLEKQQRKDFLNKIKSENQKIVLISHPYNLYDDYVNVGIKKKLKKLGAEIIFIDEVPTKQRTTYNTQHITLDYPEFHWEFGKEIMKKIQTILEDFSDKISGVIEVSSFLCGCDAVLKEFVEKAFKENEIPFLYLIIDEQTADAGVQTRLEAFMDTLH